MRERLVSWFSPGAVHALSAPETYGGGSEMRLHPFQTYTFQAIPPPLGTGWCPESLTDPTGLN